MASGGKKPNNQSRTKAKQDNRTPWLEWIASAFGLLIVLALVSLITWDIFNQGSRPPAIVLERGAVTEHAGGFALEIRARNTSAKAAAQIEIEGTLKRADGTSESARIVLDYLPGHSVRRAGLFFTHDPRTADLQLRPLGYVEP